MSKQEIGGIGFHQVVPVAGTRLRVGFERLDALCYLYRQPNGNSESLPMATPREALGRSWPSTWHLTYRSGGGEWVIQFRVRLLSEAVELGELPASVVVIPFQHFYRRKHYVAERQTYSADLRQGRVKRGSLASRYAVILVALGLVVAGLLIQGSDGAFCLL